MGGGNYIFLKNYDIYEKEREKKGKRDEKGNYIISAYNKIYLFIFREI